MPTPRQYFAGLAMQALMQRRSRYGKSKSDGTEWDNTWNRLPSGDGPDDEADDETWFQCRVAWRIADMMLETETESHLKG